MKKIIILMLILSVLIVSCDYHLGEVEIKKEAIGNVSCNDFCVNNVVDYGAKTIKDGQIEGDCCVCYSYYLSNCESIT